MSNGELNESGLIITHLTDYAPTNGFINSFRTATGATRDSVHFSVNHAVNSHSGGNWDNKLYAVLIPMEKALSGNNRFVGGVAADFYSKGRVCIPNGSVIVRYNKKIEPGTYKISDASQINKFKKLNGVKLIETSNKNICDVVNDIIPKLGYKLKNTLNPFSWGNGKFGIENFKLFNSFLKSRGMRPMVHAHTPNGRIEMLIEYIRVRAEHNKGWKAFDRNGKKISDYKKECLNALSYADAYASKFAYDKGFNTKILAEIITRAKTPNEAIKMIKKEMQLVPMHKYNYKLNNESDFLEEFRCLVGGVNSALKETDKQINLHLISPELRKAKNLFGLCEKKYS